MKSGALAWHWLEYDPDSPERLRSCLPAKPNLLGGRYISHLRSETDFWDAVDDPTIGRKRIPVQIPYQARYETSGASGSPSGFDAARAEGIEVNADIYPYTYWHRRSPFSSQRDRGPQEAEIVVRQVTPPRVPDSPPPEPAYEERHRGDRRSRNRSGADAADLIREPKRWATGETASRA
jgi:N-acyl-D-amino-acid deacylase